MSNIKLSTKAPTIDLIEEMKIKLEELQAKREETITRCRELMQAHSITPELLFPELATTVEQAQPENGTGKKRGRPAGSKNKQAAATGTPTGSTETSLEGTNDEGQVVDPQEGAAVAVIDAVDTVAQGQPALI